MSDLTNYMSLLNKMSEMAANIGAIQAKIDYMSQEVVEVKRELAAVKEQDYVQNQLLDKHILGVQTNVERLNEEIKLRKVEKELIAKQMAYTEERLKKLEVIPNLLTGIKRVLTWIGGLCSATLAIVGTLKVFGLI